MHELTICQTLIQQIVEARESRPFRRVLRVNLAIGSLSCLEPEALRYAFDILSRETFLEGAVLGIDQPPGHAVCETCGAESDVDSRLARCPACGGDHLRISGGDSLRFIDMEVA